MPHLPPRAGANPNRVKNGSRGLPTVPRNEKPDALYRQTASAKGRYKRRARKRLARARLGRRPCAPHRPPPASAGPAPPGPPRPHRPPLGASRPAQPRRAGPHAGPRVPAQAGSGGCEPRTPAAPPPRIPAAPPRIPAACPGPRGPGSRRTARRRAEPRPGRTLGLSRPCLAEAAPAAASAPRPHPPAGAVDKGSGRPQPAARSAGRAAAPRPVRLQRRPCTGPAAGRRLPGSSRGRSSRCGWHRPPSLELRQNWLPSSESFLFFFCWRRFLACSLHPAPHWDLLLLTACPSLCTEKQLASLPHYLLHPRWMCRTRIVTTPSGWQRRTSRYNGKTPTLLECPIKAQRSQ